MKITNVTAHPMTAQWQDDPWFPSALFSTVLIRIETDGGSDGLGETTLGYFAPEVVLALVDWYKPVLLNQDPLNTLHLTRELYNTSVWWARSGAGRAVISGIELALWDLKGKALGVPVYQLLGGKVQERIPVYASGGPAIWPLEENLRKIENYANLGYRTAKISTDFYEMQPPSEGSLHRIHHTPLPFADKIETLRQNFERLRREFGSGFDFAIDGHQGGVPNPIPASEAIEIAEALAPFRLRFYEEPLAYTDVEGYLELRSRSRIPIGGGESLSGLDQFHPLISRKGLHLIQPDMGFVGGLQEMVRIMHHAEAYNIGCIPHTGASFGPVLAASLHFAAAFESVAWVEQVVACRSVHLDWLGEEFMARDGHIRLPDRPGLGVSFAPELLKKYPFVANSGERT